MNLSLEMFNLFSTCRPHMIRLSHSYNHCKISVRICNFENYMCFLKNQEVHTSESLAYSAIHKAAIWPAAIQNGVWRAFCMVVSFDILGIVPGKPVEQLGTMRLAAL